ncbi:hypothetical protein EVAR_97782_1 [Eumeta japonica]|uniref:Uncharacterized protein n=1 Tax=Eumeta variegata TaxID=151549 RepID=A0A4C2A4B5_EUMVA|nr:hypothetical protein EVAR_97782_1 [Eumeta japonica]
MVEIKPSHKAFWGLAKAFKTEKAVPTPARRKLDNSIAFDDREKAECLADSIEQHCSENPSFEVEHVRRVEESPFHRKTIRIPSLKASSKSESRPVMERKSQAELGSSYRFETEKDRNRKRNQDRSNVELKLKLRSRPESEREVVSRSCLRVESKSA